MNGRGDLERFGVFIFPIDSMVNEKLHMNGGVEWVIGNELKNRKR